MNRLKDFFYNKNDIIVVLLILMAAAFIIYDRMDVIMSYPQTYANQVLEKNMDKDDSNKKQEAESNTQGSEASEKGTSEDGRDTVRIKIEDNDTLSAVATKLEKKGLIKSADEFVSFVASKDAEGDLIVGTYEIVPGSSSDKILEVITK